mmetsp:Transcript_15695/g.49113  ORF Transcript_15695/g.49113 Transcript_15695/m.49113 type:complete len:250 (-) Transcript_15695:70-819(-)
MRGVLGAALAAGAVARRDEGVLLPPPSFSVELNSTAGFEVLTRSLHRSYLQVAIHFETQASESLCGIASIAAVFNALAVEPTPVDPTYSPYSYWTQATIVNDSCVAAVHDPSYGSTRSQLAAMVSTCYEVDVLNVSAPSSLDVARTLVVEALRDDAETHLVANFDRAGLDEAGGGHFSPIVAYDVLDDLVLMLDVAKYKYPPLWLPLDDLLAAMADDDPISSEPRGFLVLSRRDATRGAAAAQGAALTS